MVGTVEFQWVITEEVSQLMSSIMKWWLAGEAESIRDAFREALKEVPTLSQLCLQ